MSNTINIHAQFSGVVADAIEEIIRSGRAASRTEAIRVAILDYREHHLSKEDEKAGWLAVSEKSLAKVWSNKKDDETWSRY